MSSDKAPSAGDGEARAAGVEGMVGQSSSPTRPPPGAGPRANTGGFVGAAEVPEVTREEDAPLADDELLVKDAEDEVVDEEVVLEDVTLISPASPLLPAARLAARRRATSSGLRREEPQLKDPPGGGVGETPAPGAMVVSTDQDENVDSDDDQDRFARTRGANRARTTSVLSVRSRLDRRSEISRAGDECAARRARASKTCRRVAPAENQRVYRAACRRGEIHRL